MDSSDDEADCLVGATFFQPREDDQVLKTFDIGRQPISLSLYTNPASTTDYHLTGTIVWPVSQLLAHYLASRPEIFPGRHVAEIGAGCALAGLVVAKLSPLSCAITDGEKVVLRIIERNVKHLELDPALVTTKLLRWGDQASAESFLAAYPDRLPSIVVGADVFHPSFGEPHEVFDLILTIADRTRPAVEFVCGLVDRNNREKVLMAAKQAGFDWEIHEPETFLPEMLTLEVLSLRKLELFHFSHRFGEPQQAVSDFQAPTTAVEEQPDAGLA